MKDVKIEDVVKSMWSSTDDKEAIKILQRYCAHVVKGEKSQWVADEWRKKQEALEASSFAKAIKFIEYASKDQRPSLPERGRFEPSNKDILTALKLVVEEAKSDKPN